ncbi:MAG: Asp23/Gls24 family envelope stress response protein [Oscillospiraceae bacterium]|nr:Asp23/Gls24 family envelope stress response protein [Oscillospiraceae bacterium]
MGNHDSMDGIGGLVISDEVLAAIAMTAARDIEGVSAILPRPADVARLFHPNDVASRYVKVISAENDVKIQMSLRIQSGLRISSVAGAVQRAVKNAIQNMTGHTVSRVNLNVEGAEFPAQQAS